VTEWFQGPKMADVSTEKNQPNVRRPEAIVLYSRPVCSLCDVVKPIVAAVAADLNLTVDERNVEESPEWESRYGHQVPVAFLGDYKLCKYRVEGPDLARQLRRHLAVA